MATCGRLFSISSNPSLHARGENPAGLFWKIVARIFFVEDLYDDATSNVDG
jgi:hypothetical protein